MAKAAQIWINNLGADVNGLYKLVNWVHDEWQTEVKVIEQFDLPMHIAQEQIKGLEEAGRQLKMNLKITGGKPKIGMTWAETH